MFKSSLDSSIGSASAWGLQLWDKSWVQVRGDLNVRNDFDRTLDQFTALHPTQRIKKQILNYFELFS